MQNFSMVFTFLGTIYEINLRFEVEESYECNVMGGIDFSGLLIGIFYFFFKE